MPKLRWLYLLLLAVLWACSADSPPSPTAGTLPSVTTSSSTTVPTTPPTSAAEAEASTLRVGSVVPVSNLDPADAYTFPEWELLHAISEGLLVLEPGSGDVAPGLAEGPPEIDSSRHTYTFGLRPEIQFADGTMLTAPMYADAIRRVMDLGGQGSGLVTSFVADVEAPDDDTVVFSLTGDYAFFPTVVAGAPYLPVHPDAFPSDRLEPLPEPPIYGVGPWFIDRQSPAEVVLERSDHYQGSPVAIERIVVRYFDSVDEMAAEMAEGELDVIWRGVGAEMAAALAGEDAIRFEEVPGGALQFLVVNHGLPPTDDPRVRQAIARLTDRGSIAEKALGGAVESAFSAIPPGLLASNESFREMYGEEPDVEAAVELLTEAGYSQAAPAQVELAYPPERYGVELAGAIEDLERQLEASGLIEVTLTAQPWNTYVGDVVDGTYHLAFLEWLYDFPDPHNYLAPFILDGGLGGSGVTLENDHPEMVEMFMEAAGEPDENRRAALYRGVQALFARDVVTLPLWLDHEYIAYWDHVAGDPALPYPETLNIGPTMQLDYRSLRLDPEGLTP
ncbi:MAG: ABC transporter substrate-binding protein [Acidimicrobiia bacterium]